MEMEVSPRTRAKWFLVSVGGPPQAVGTRVKSFSVAT